MRSGESPPIESVVVEPTVQGRDPVVRSRGEWRLEKRVLPKRPLGLEVRRPSTTDRERNLITHSFLGTEVQAKRGTCDGSDGRWDPERPPTSHEKG